VADQLTVATPERVALSLPLAGLGSRAIAYLIDLAVVFGFAAVAYFIYAFFDPDLTKTWQAASGFARAMFGLGVFAITWVYWTALEALWRGQTPGKRAMRIRVVRSDGAPATVVECAVRNLVRVVDFAPACYPVGLISMLVDSKHRRLGDLVAGTLLVREEQVDLDRYAKVRQTAQKLSDADLELLTQFLARADTLDAASRTQLAEQISKKLGGPAEGAEQYLRSLT
jgi:uncharacterized RDD family membrane protein YckC